MHNWMYDEPADELATHNKHVVRTEQQIVDEHLAYYRERYPEATEQDAINEWVVIHWAGKTNEQPGDTITKLEKSNEQHT